MRTRPFRSINSKNYPYNHSPFAGIYEQYLLCIDLSSEEAHSKIEQSEHANLYSHSLQIGTLHFEERQISSALPVINAEIKSPSVIWLIGYSHIGQGKVAPLHENAIAPFRHVLYLLLVKNSFRDIFSTLSSPGGREIVDSVLLLLERISDVNKRNLE